MQSAKTQIYGLLVSEGEKNVMNICLAIVLIVLFSALSFFISYKIFYRKGFKKGEKFREDEILNEYCVYIPFGEVGDFVKELMEEDGYSEYFPMLVIMPDKYNYLEGVVPPEETR